MKIAVQCEVSCFECSVLVLFFVSDRFLDLELVLRRLCGLDYLFMNEIFGETSDSVQTINKNIIVPLTNPIKNIIINNI